MLQTHNWFLTVSSSCTTCTSDPGQFLSPVWGTGDVLVVDVGRTGRQDVILITAQSDLLPAPRRLSQLPPPHTQGPTLTASSSSRGRVRVRPHTTPCSTNWLILTLPPLFAFLFFRFVPLFCPNRLAASQLLPATVCMHPSVGRRSDKPRSGIYDEAKRSGHEDELEVMQVLGSAPCLECIPLTD
ncbi:unnamed protein product [Pleuronectes platessa]|uniref:Uncharacterized protein n=1 Tax=Pleuronectes platessa TaxID=8262 RepID=A0A9N7Z5D8_PLEPL|nr:unnamed protein product [Pleuronectes platessa]